MQTPKGATYVVIKASTAYPDNYNKKKKWRQHKRCKSCIYRSSNNSQEINGCDYLCITGRSRTEQLSPEEMNPAVCPLYVNGKKLDARGGIVLNGTRQRGKIHQDEFLALYATGATDKEIAQHFRVSVKHAASYCKCLELKANQKRPTRIEYDKMGQLYAEGMIDKDIAEKVGCSVGTVAQWRWEHNLLDNKQIALNKRNEKFKEYYDQGLLDWDIAELMGVRTEVVKRWRCAAKLPSHFVRGGNKNG